MNATEIQTLDVARELALKKITDNRVNRFSSGTKLIFSRVDVTLTRDNVDVTKDFNLHLEYLEEEGEICVKCSSQKSKNQYDVVFFYIKDILKFWNFLRKITLTRNTYSILKIKSYLRFISI